MEIIRISKDSGAGEVCYVRCEKHNYFFNARPPEQHGCDSCWMTYYIGQRAMMKPNQMDEGLSQLEAAIHGMEAEIAKGDFDLQLLDSPIIEITHEDD
jgi:hypothetical protein